MKKLLLTIAVFAIGVVCPCFAQNKQEQKEAKMEKKQHLIEVQHGHHFGATLTSSSMPGIDQCKKNGVLFFYGNRLTEHWMVGGYAGAECLTPTTVESDVYIGDGDDSLERPLMSFPIMGTARFYFGTAKLMPYLFTDIGVSVSKYTDYMWNFGLGLDFNIKKSHTIFFSAGIGSTPVPGIKPAYEYDKPELENQQRFAFNLKFGYYF